ncbi:uncharacterized protein [Antedon mediterranea]|uniref:uncharacterized protein n=1 Tax=Antedon mediterranea TaxID=105859 RepID=UPI003AF6727F
MTSTETVPNTSEVRLSKTTLNSNTEDPSRNSAVVTAAAHWKSNRLQSISLPPNTNLLRADSALKEEDATSDPSDQQHSRKNSRTSLIPGSLPHNVAAQNGQNLAPSSEIIKYQIQAAAVIGQGINAQNGELVENANTRVGDSLLFTIPYMDVKLAYICLFLNIVIPGLGTILSGFSVLCLSSSTPQDDRKQDEVIQLCCSNLCVGLSQMFTITFFLVGWIWSITWGVNMVLLANHHRKTQQENRNLSTTVSVARAFMRM